MFCENAHVPIGNDNDQNLLRHSASQSVSQLFHGPAPRSPLHRLAVRLRTNSDERGAEGPPSGIHTTHSSSGLRMCIWRDLQGLCGLGFEEATYW